MDTKQMGETKDETASNPIIPHEEAWIDTRIQSVLKALNALLNRAQTPEERFAIGAIHRITSDDIQRP